MTDAQMTTLLGIPALFSLGELGVELPGDEALWDAPSAEAWAQVADRVLLAGQAGTQSRSPGSLPAGVPFVKVLTAAMRGQPEIVPMTDFGRAILAYSLFR